MEGLLVIPLRLDLVRDFKLSYIPGFHISSVGRLLNFLHEKKM